MSRPYTANDDELILQSTLEDITKISLQLRRTRSAVKNRKLMLRKQIADREAFGVSKEKVRPSVFSRPAWFQEDLQAMTKGAKVPV